MVFKFLINLSKASVAWLKTRKHCLSLSVEYGEGKEMNYFSVNHFGNFQELLLDAE